MSHLQRVSWILGALLLGASAILAFNRDGEARRLRSSAEPAVDKLADDLNRAWSGHHIP